MRVLNFNVRLVWEIPDYTVFFHNMEKFPGLELTWSFRDRKVSAHFSNFSYT